MSEPCTNEARIAVLESKMDGIASSISGLTSAIERLTVALAKIEGGSSLGRWALPLIVSVGLVLINKIG